MGTWRAGPGDQAGAEKPPQVPGRAHDRCLLELPVFQSRGQDLPSHQLHHQRLPGRVHPHRVSRRRGRAGGRVGAGAPGSPGSEVGPGGPGLGSRVGRGAGRAPGACRPENPDTALLLQFRQLFCECDGGRKTGQPGPVGHRGTGGLRPPAATLLPPNRR